MREQLSMQIVLQKLSVIEAHDADGDALERDKVREHEIRVLKMRRPVNNVDQPLADSAMRPKPPVNKDENIISYIIIFERLASLLRQDPASFAVRIRSLQNGKHKKIAALNPEITSDYGSLKAALFSGFSKTPES